MKSFVVFAVILAAAAAATVSSDFEAPVIRSQYDITPEGNFQYIYETANGISGQAQGELLNSNSDHPSLSVRGAYKYTAPDGTPVELVYTAGDEGFKPEGSHLPVPPPTPEPIARALAYIAAHPPPPESPAKVGASRFR